LLDKGLDAAVAQWESLKSDHADEYDLGHWQFYGLVDAVGMAKAQGVDRLARLCASILAPAELLDLEKAVEPYQNEAAAAALAVFREHRTSVGEGVEPGRAA
jgi:hypothetical protein